MRGPNIHLGEWCRILPLDVSGCPVSPVHILQHLSFLCTLGERWCAPPVVMCMLMADDSIYQDLSLVGNLSTIFPWGRYHHLLRWTNAPTSPIGREPIVNMSHQERRSSLSLALGGYMS